MFWKQIKNWPCEEHEISLDDQKHKIKIYHSQIYDVIVFENAVIADDAYLGPNCKINGNIQSGCCIGANTGVGLGVTVFAGTIIGNDCEILSDINGCVGNDVRIKLGCSIQEMVSIGDNSIIAEGSSIGAGSQLEGFNKLGLKACIGQNVLLQTGTNIGLESSVSDNLELGTDNLIMPKCQINANMGNDNYIEDGCEINFKIGNFNRLRKRCKINAEIEDNTFIGNDCEINSFVGSRTEIEDGVKINFPVGKDNNITEDPQGQIFDGELL